MTPREEWVPIRHVWSPQRCDFCWLIIPRTGTLRGVVAPGVKRHAAPRGGVVLAWWQPQRNVLECNGCHAELERVELVRTSQMITPDNPPRGGMSEHRGQVIA